MIDAEATVFNTVSAINYFIWNSPESDLDRAHAVTRIMAMPAPKDIYYEFQERFGIRFHEGYGLTETGMVTYVPPDIGGKPGSCGRSTPGFEVSVVDPESDMPQPPDTPGEIVVDMKIPNIMMRAYTGMPQKTADDFRNLKVHTGDLGKMDDEGYLYFMDRVKDYIRRRGENVSSMEVERIVASFDGIDEAAAIGVAAGEGAGSEQEILVCVVAEDGATPDCHALLSYCGERMPYFAVPRYVRVMDALPQDTDRACAQGGVARAAARRQLLRPRGGGPSAIALTDDLDPGEAINYILAQRPTLAEEAVWAVVGEMDRPPGKDADPLAVELIAQTHPEIAAADVRTILKEWRSFAELSDERDWDDDELDYVNRHDD